MTPRLCLIEDDVLMGESLCDRFALEGIAFDWHRDGASALRSIERGPTRQSLAMCACRT